MFGCEPRDHPISAAQMGSDSSCYPKSLTRDREAIPACLGPPILRQIDGVRQSREGAPAEARSSRVSISSAMATHKDDYYNFGLHVAMVKDKVLLYPVNLPMQQSTWPRRSTPSSHDMEEVTQTITTL